MMIDEHPVLSFLAILCLCGTAINLVRIAGETTIYMATIAATTNKKEDKEK